MFFFLIYCSFYSRGKLLILLYVAGVNSSRLYLPTKSVSLYDSSYDKNSLLENFFQSK